MIPFTPTSSHAISLVFFYFIFFLSSLVLSVLICLRLKFKGGVTNRGDSKGSYSPFLVLRFTLCFSRCGRRLGFFLNFVYTDTLASQNIE